MLGRKIQLLLEVSREEKRPSLVGTVILVFLSIFKKSQASSPFETLNSAQILMSQMDVRPSVQKSLKTMASSRVSTDRKSTRLNSSHVRKSRMPSSA